MRLLAVTTVLLVAVFLTCSADRCGYRNRIRKHHITQMYMRTPPTTTSLITKTTSTSDLNIVQRHHQLENITYPPMIMPNRECILQNGKRLKVGEKYTKSLTGACYIYECKPERVITEIVKCPPAMCVDYVTLDGACCPSCPTGTNCRLPSGRIITHPVVYNGMKCECPPNRTSVTGLPPAIYYTAICTPLHHITKAAITSTTKTTTTTRTTTKSTTPPTTTRTTTKSTTPPTTTRTTTKSTTPPTTTRTTTKSTECILNFGVTLKVGQKYTKEFPGGCYVLECTPERVIGAIVKCTPPMCVDYVKPVGACCPSCPRGNNCRLPSGEIITHPVVYHGMKCECPTNRTLAFGLPSGTYYTAICTPLHHMTTTTTRSTKITTSTTRSSTPSTRRTTPRLTTVRTTTRPTPRTSTIPSTNTTHPCPTTKPPTPHCVTKTGKWLNVGQKYIKALPGMCYIFECTPEKLVTTTVTCPRPMCVDYITPAGECCPICPKRRSCKLPSGEIISHPVIRDGKKCECSIKHRKYGSPPSVHNNAICRPLISGRY